MEALRPEPLETGRLSEALADVAGRWSALHQIPVQVTTTGTARPMPHQAEFALLRTAQEALANVARHAQATRVGVTLSYMEHEVALDVRDDGRGFDLAQPCAAPPARLNPPRRRVRPGRDAAAHREPGRDAAGRIRAGLRHRHLGLPPGRAGGLVSRPEPGAVIKLLIADDHPVVRDGLSSMFARDPEFEVLGEAADGAEAVTLAQALEPDVILMDLRMPGMDGLTAITELASRGVPARILVLTTYDTDSYVLPAIEAGATGYMLKDAPRAELLHAVRAAAQGQAVLSPAVTARLMSRVRAPGAGPLSHRELEVLELVASGATNREAAARLFITEATVKTHLLNIYAKLGVGDRAAAVAEAFNRGLLTPGHPNGRSAAHPLLTRNPGGGAGLADYRPAHEVPACARIADGDRARHPGDRPGRRRHLRPGLCTTVRSPHQDQAERIVVHPPATPIPRPGAQAPRVRPAAGPSPNSFPWMCGPPGPG